MDKQNFVVGQVVLAQLGNPTDVNFRGVKECRITAVRTVEVDEKTGWHLYLIEPTDGEAVLCCSTDVSGRQDEVGVDSAVSLYSTDGRTYGPGSTGEKFGFNSKEAAMRSLGY